MSYQNFIESIYPPNELHRQILLKYRTTLLPLLRSIDTTNRDDNNDRKDRSLIRLLSKEILIRESGILSGFIGDILTSKSLYKIGEPSVYEVIDYNRRTGERQIINVEGFSIPNYIKQAIINDYDVAGYVFTYFGFLNKNEPRVMIYMKRRGVTLPGAENLPVEPNKENYEIASNIITLQSYNEFLSRVKRQSARSAFHDSFKNDYVRGQGLNLLGGIGWSKRDIVNAIVNTGLTQVVKNKRRILDLPTYDGDLMSDRIRKNRIPINLDGMPLDDVLQIATVVNTTETNRRGNYLIGFGVVRKQTTYDSRLGRWVDIPTKATFKNTYYMPKLYYEMIYRKVLNTLAYVDWKQVCQNQTLSFDNLMEAAKALGVPIGGVSYPELCNKIDLYSGQQRYASTPGISISQIPQSISSFSSGPKPSFSSVSIPSGYIESSRPSNYPEYQERQGEQSMASMITSGLSEPLKRRQVAFQSQEEMLISEQITILCSQRMPSDEIEKKAYLYDVLTLARKMNILDLFPQDMITMTQDQICSILSSNVELGEEEFKISRR